MPKTRKLSLKLKLPLIMVALTATFLVTVSFLVYSMAEKSIRQFVYASKETAAPMITTVRVISHCPRTCGEAPTSPRTHFYANV